MKIIPAIDIIGGKTVRLEMGRYDRKLSYDKDPVSAAREWRDMGAELIHVIDLDGAKRGKPVNLAVAGAIAKASAVPVEVGGGFRNEEDIERALDAGVWRVILGSRALEDTDFAAGAMKKFKESVILSVDADKNVVKVRGWEKSLDKDIFETIGLFSSLGAREMIYTDISRDGTLAGPDTGALRRILEKSGMAFIYAGGVKTVEHLLELKKLESAGLTGAIVGRALYDGTLDLGEAINACKTDNTVS